MGVATHPDLAPHSDLSTHLAWLRTRLSVERTLMAWLRTATGLISFGFSIVELFDRFGKMADVAAAKYPGAPWHLGLALIAAGTIGLAFAAIQYRVMIRYLWSPELKACAGIYDDRPRHTLVLVAAAVIVAIGIVAFFAVLLRSR